MTDKTPQPQAKQAVAGWIDDPAQSPTPTDDEMTRTGDLNDPALNVPDPDTDDGTAVEEEEEPQ